MRDNIMVFDSFTTDDFFSIFIGSYVCAMREDGGQVNGCVPTDEVQNGVYTDYDEVMEKNFFGLNKMGYGIHFTPNGVKTSAERNKTTNIDYINSFWVEIDIEESKVLVSDEDYTRRKERKAEILGYLFNLDFKYFPSFTVESRNGFQVYWFTNNATKQDFDIIQQCLYKRFKDVGADYSAMRINSMLRVPYFKYNKKGEEGLIEPIPFFSTLRLYTTNEMFEFLCKEVEVVKQEIKDKFLEEFERNLKSRAVYAGRKPADLGAGNFGKLQKILKFPIKNFLLGLSGMEEVKGDKFTFHENNEGKLNVLVNGKNSPNWIDVEKNMIFSNNKKGMWNIVHYLQFYGHKYQTTLEILGKLM